MENKKILFIYTGGHYVHRKFADCITKDSIKSSWKIPKDYSFYFCEGEFFKVVILRMLGLINKKSKIIALFSDPRLFYFDSGFRFNVKKQRVEKYPKIKKVLFNFLLKKLDGAICVGKFEESLLKKYFKGPIKVVYPFIREEKYSLLKRIKPSLKEKNVLCITTWGDYYCKGLDFVIDIFDELKKEIPEIKVSILGELNALEEWKKKDLFFEGYQKVEDYLKKNSLSIHFGRGESFGIDILESLLAGVPVIVSEHTGAKEVIEKVNSEFVIPMDKKIAVNAIKGYFALDTNKKERTSIKGRKIALKFSEKPQVERFLREFKKLIKEIK